MAAIRQKNNYLEDEGEGLLFGEFCFACGNESTSGPYCSSDCRNADATRSPDFSPTTSTLPLLSSSKSICSTPPSSINHSPSPIEALMADRLVGEEPEPLDLSTALALKFDYNGASLPNGLRYPTPSYSLHDPNPQDINHPTKELSSTSLGYKRKSSGAPNQVPSPLYYRQQAAQHSPSPSSPPKAPFSPRYSPARPPTISRSQVSAFALPPAIKSAPLLFTSSSAEFEPIVKKARASMSALADSRPNLLFSPRIRALRSEDAVVINEEKEDLRDELLEPEDSDSAFTRYLFAQLAVKNSSTVGVEEREGRSIVGAVTGEKRSLSADSVFPSRNLSTTVRPTRFLFGRGTSVEGMIATSESTSSPFSPPLSPSQETAQNLTLTPGRFITATFDSPSTSALPSPFPSPPLSPPTFIERGRSDTRRKDESSPSSLSNSVQPSIPAIDPRGRSKLRTLTSVQRDLSPTRDISSSSSRGRRSSPGREEIRMTSSSRARVERAEVGRGRVRRESFDDEDDEESAREGRGRSRSLARVGRAITTR